MALPAFRNPIMPPVAISAAKTYPSKSTAMLSVKKINKSK